MTDAELEPLGISPIAWAALNCFGHHPDLSQRDAAEMLGIDRSKMVGLVDELQANGWVERRAQSHDRRKNSIVLTGSGADLLRRGSRVIDRCEQRSLAALDRETGTRLKDALVALIEAAQ